MAREYLIVWAGRHRRDSWDALVGDYLGRIRHWNPVREVPVKVRRAGDDASRLVAEGEAILAALPDPCWLVALDRRGRNLSSEDLAARLERLGRDWPHPVAFVLGSDLGLAPAVLAAARLTLSFGKMTFPHELARVMLAEQVYRALCIQAGIQYHRQSL